MSNDGRRPASDGADGDPPDDPELRNRVELREQLRSSLAGDAEWIVESEQHLLKVFRFYLLVLGGFVSVLSVLITRENNSISGLVNVYTVSAIAFWAIAALGAVVAFTVIWAKIGVDEIHHSSHEITEAGEFKDDGRSKVFKALDLDRLVDSPPKEFEDRLIHHYIQAIHHNERELTHVRYPFLYGGMFLVLVAVLVFAVGILVPATAGGGAGFLPCGPIDLMQLLGRNAKNKVSCSGGFGSLVGYVLLSIGSVASLFLILQMMVFYERVGKKLSMSEASNPVGYLWKRFLKASGGESGEDENGKHDGDTTSESDEASESETERDDGVE